MRINPQRRELVKLWDEDEAARCSHRFVFHSSMLGEGTDGVLDRVDIYRCVHCRQLRRPKWPGDEFTS
jgi:hypothetical protein